MLRETWSPPLALCIGAGAAVLGLIVLSLGTLGDRAVLFYLSGLSWVIVGAYGRVRHPGPQGALALLAGLTWLLARLDEADDPTLFTIGNVIALLDVPFVTALILAYPGGALGRSPAALGRDRRPSRRLQALLRLLVALTAVGAVAGQLWVLFTPAPNLVRPEIVGRNHLVSDSPAIAAGIQNAQAVVLVAAAACGLVLFERGFRMRDALHRGSHQVVRLGVWLIAGTAFLSFLLHSWSGAVEALSLIQTGAFLSLPILFGFAVFRWHEVEAAVMSSLNARADESPDAIEGALREELRDPSITLHLGSDAPGRAASERASTTAPLDAGGETLDFRSSPTRSPLHAPDGRRLGVVTHGPRTPDSALLDRAIAWAGTRLAPCLPATAPTTEDLAEIRRRLDRLTPAETDTIRLMAQSLTNQEIADRLVVALGTVNNRISTMYRKLGLKDAPARERAARITLLAAVLEADGDRPVAPRDGS
ncbi:MAG: helix-turn-helix transcriptional regulator [Actinomycetota bacterium]